MSTQDTNGSTDADTIDAFSRPAYNTRAGSQHTPEAYAAIQARDNVKYRRERGDTIARKQFLWERRTWSDLSWSADRVYFEYCLEGILLIHDRHLTQDLVSWFFFLRIRLMFSKLSQE